MNLSQLKHASLLSSSGLISALISLVTLPILTRIYSPKEFGIAAVCISATAILGAVATLRYDVALVVADNRRKAAALFFFALFLSAASSTVLYFIVCCFPTSEVLRSATDNTQSLYLWMALGAFFVGCYNTLTQWHVRDRLYRLQSLCVVMVAVVTNLVPILFFILSGGSEPLYIVQGYVLGYGVASICSVVVILRMGKAPPLWFDAREYLHALREFGDFPKYSLPVIFAAVARDRGAPIVLGSLVSVEVAGAFSVIQRLLNFPVSILSQGLRPIMFNAVIEDLREAAKLQQNVSRLLITLSIPCQIAVIALDEAFVSAILGVEWAPFANLVLPMMPYAIVLCLCNWLDRVYDGTERLRWAAGYEIINAVATIIVLVTMLGMGFSAIIGVGAYSVVFFLLSLYYIQKASYILGADSRIIIYQLSLGCLIALAAGVLVREQVLATQSWHLELAVLGGALIWLLISLYNASRVTDLFQDRESRK